MALVVSDTSPIRALAHLQLVNLLRELFDAVLIPPAVAAELVNAPVGLPSIDPATFLGIEVRAPQDQKAVQRFLQDLDPGESEALALALEVRAAAVLMDEAADGKWPNRLACNRSECWESYCERNNKTLSQPYHRIFND